MPLSDIVSVSIDRQTRAVSQQGFGTLLIAGTNLTGPAYQIYSSLPAVSSVLPANTPERLALAAAFAQTPTPDRVVVAKVDTAAIGASLTTLNLSFYDWYGLVLTSRDPVVQKAASVWAEANRKLMAVASSDPVMPTSATTDIASILSTLNHNRTIVLYDPTAGSTVAAAPDVFADAAWLARQLSTTPGAETWMFKTLAGVAASTLTDTESATARTKRANTYESIGGVSITREGRVASGEYIDVIVGTDWLRARLTERVYNRLANLPKVPYTDAGVAIFEAEIRAQLSAAVAAGVLASDPQPTIHAPRVRDIAPQDRANRLLPDIRFAATLAGAVHSVRISGVVSV